jgi:hypothetical protein
MGYMDVNQRDPEWLQMRVGCTTASRVFEIIERLKVNAASGKKGDYKKSRRTYMIELICERLTGRASDHYVNDWMVRGTEDEDLARAAYERLQSEELGNGGFFLHDSIEYFGASPDSTVGDKGLLELKNLKPEKHYEILRGATIPEEYVWQMNAQLACAPEREWVDYGSYCKEMLSPKLRLFVRRHLLDQARVEELEAEVVKFNAELAAELTALANNPAPTLQEQLEASLEAVQERAAQ